MTTTIYTLSDPTEGTERAFPSLRAAKKYREKFYSRRDRGEITQIEVAEMPLRERLCACFNREQFAASRRPVS